jgi:hypothetical protein
MDRMLHYSTCCVEQQAGGRQFQTYTLYFNFNRRQRKLSTNEEDSFVHERTAQVAFAFNTPWVFPSKPARCNPCRVVRNDQIRKGNIQWTALTRDCNCLCCFCWRLWTLKKKRVKTNNRQILKLEKRLSPVLNICLATLQAFISWLFLFFFPVRPAIDTH